MKRSLARLSIPLREPFATAGGVVAARELVLLRLEDSDGAVGFGEAAPLEPYDGVTIDEVLAALRDGDGRGRAGRGPGRAGPGQAGRGPGRAGRGAPGPSGPPQARAAEEMALLDLEASRAGRAIGEPGAEVIPVNRTLAGGPPAEVAERAAEGVRQGYSCFKLKVGLPDDEERVAAVREAVGPWPALRIDANGAWSPRQAVATIERLARFDLQLVEQPCATLEEMAAVRREVDVPIAADESVSTPADVRVAAECEACDIVNVKLAPSGGFSAARAALREAAAHGLGAFLSSTLDGPWGISAALQLAAGERVQLACGLATLELFDAALALALPPPADGVLVVPQGPGLGLAIDDAAIAEVLVEELGE